MPYTQLSPMGVPGARYSFIAKAFAASTVESATGSTRLPVTVTVSSRKMTVTQGARFPVTVTVGARS